MKSHIPKMVYIHYMCQSVKKRRRKKLASFENSVDTLIRRLKDFIKRLKKQHKQHKYQQNNNKNKTKNGKKNSCINTSSDKQVKSHTRRFGHGK